MKEPIKRELSKKEYEQEKYVEKIIGIKHFCPMCDKLSVEYFYEHLENGEMDMGEPTYEENSFTIDEETWLFKIIFVPHDGIFFDEEEETICLSPEELGLNSKYYKNRILKIIKNYYDKFNIKNEKELTFCSKKCAKKFLIEQILQEKSNE